MKTLPSILLLLALSCTAREVPEAESTLRLRFGSGVPTRAERGDAPSERMINDLYLLVRDVSSGRLDACEHYTGLDVDDWDEVSVVVRSGEKTISAYANWPGDDFEAAVPLENSSFSTMSFPMTGSLGMVALPGEEVSATISLARIVARVSLCSLVNRLPSGAGLTLNGAYLSGIGEYADFECPEQTVWRPDEPIIIAASSRWDAVFSATQRGSRFYAVPSSSGSPPARLVVECSINGHRRYYPLPMPVLQANTDYRVSLTVTGIGSPSPDTPVEPVDYSFSVSAAPWESGASYTENF